MVVQSGIRDRVRFRADDFLRCQLFPERNAVSYTHLIPATHGAIKSKNFVVQNVGDVLRLKKLETFHFMMAGPEAVSYTHLLSFFIQMDRAAKKGLDFRPRFLWRLVLLLAIGYLHGLIVRVDILLIYAILGFVLVLMYKWPTKLLAGRCV